MYIQSSPKTASLKAMNNKISHSRDRKHKSDLLSKNRHFLRDKRRNEISKIFNDEERLSQLGRSLSKADGKYRRNQRKVYVETYKVACELATDDARYTAFCKIPIWKECSRAPKATNRDDVLLYAFQLLLDPTDSGQRSKASKCRRALQVSFEKGRSPDKVAKLLKKKGVERLARENATPKKPLNSTQKQLDAEFTKKLTKIVKQLPNGLGITVARKDGRLKYSKPFKRTK